MKSFLKKYFFQTEYNGTAHITKSAYFTSALVVFLFIILIFTFAFSQLQYNFNWGAVYQYRAKFYQGFLMTIIISIFSLLLSLIVGTIFAFGQRSTFLPFRFFSKTFVEIIRGTPLLVQILIFFYVVADAFRLENRYVVGVLIMAFFAGAYVSEIIRSGIESVSESQLESA
ncbi:MAG TPA: ABC transporter permease subunit, partial [Bacteroidetes bacterium]|nr:ABC transporter permease subunit [Bacteroidota bacterium]